MNKEWVEREAVVTVKATEVQPEGTLLDITPVGDGRVEEEGDQVE